MRSPSMLPLSNQTGVKAGRGFCSRVFEWLPWLLCQVEVSLPATHAPRASCVGDRKEAGNRALPSGRAIRLVMSGFYANHRWQSVSFTGSGMQEISAKNPNPYSRESSTWRSASHSGGCAGDVWELTEIPGKGCAEAWGMAWAHGKGGDVWLFRE